MDLNTSIIQREQIIKTLRSEVELLISEAEAVSKKLNIEEEKNVKKQIPMS